MPTRAYSFTSFKAAWFNATPNIGEPRWCYDTAVKETEVEWEDMVDLFVNSSHRITTTKELTPMFNSCNWKSINDQTVITKETKYNKVFVAKTAKNVIDSSMLILDYDDGTSIADVLEQLVDYKHIGYTSFSHTPEHNKFRVIIPLTQPIPANLMMKTKDSEHSVLPALFDIFGHIDLTTFDSSRAFFMPSCPIERAQYAQSWCNDGKEFDWTELPVTVTFKQRYVQSNKNDVFDLLSAFKTSGLYIGSLGGIKHQVLCPWSDTHTSDVKGGTVVWEGQGWCCKHSSCDKRVYLDLLDFFGLRTIIVKKEPLAVTIAKRLGMTNENTKAVATKVGK